MTSRTQVADYLADHLYDADRSSAIQSSANWLKENNKTRQAPYFISDVINSLSKKGYLFAKITTARLASNDTKSIVIEYIKNLPGVNKVECEWVVDPEIIGGTIIETPIGILDSSVKGRLAKIVEGVSL
jgi:F0F1-type ATP synthase delta subunit